MTLKKKDISIIESYLKGELDKEQCLTIENRLKEDVDFKNQYEFVLHMKEGVKYNVLQEKMDFLKEVDRSMDVEAPQSKSRGNTYKVRKLNWWKWVAAASILIVGVVGYQWWVDAQEDRRQDELFAQYFEPLPSPYSTTRSETTSDSLSFLKRKAYNLYAIEAYKEAAPMLEQVFEEEKDTLCLLYAGIAYLGARDLEKAEEVLERYGGMREGDERVEKLRDIIYELQ